MATRAILKRRPKILTGPIEVTEAYVPAVSPLADILTQIAYVFFAILEGLLVIRFVLRLSGADVYNSFVAWVYNTTSLFVAPFESMFAAPAADSSVLEVGTLVAMVAYLFIFYLAVALFRLFVPGETVVDPGEEY